MRDKGRQGRQRVFVKSPRNPKLHNYRPAKDFLKNNDENHESSILPQFGSFTGLTAEPEDVKTVPESKVEIESENDVSSDLDKESVTSSNNNSENDFLSDNDTVDSTIINTKLPDSLPQSLPPMYLSRDECMPKKPNLIQNIVNDDGTPTVPNKKPKVDIKIEPNLNTPNHPIINLSNLGLELNHAIYQDEDQNFYQHKKIDQNVITQAKMQNHYQDPEIRNSNSNSQPGLVSQMKSEFIEEELEIPPKKGKIEFKCSYCGKIFEKQTSWKGHEKNCPHNPNAEKYRNLKEKTIKDASEIENLKEHTENNIESPELNTNENDDDEAEVGSNYSQKVENINRNIENLTVDVKTFEEKTTKHNFLRGGEIIIDVKKPKRSSPNKQTPDGRPSNVQERKKVTLLRNIPGQKNLFKLSSNLLKNNESKDNRLTLENIENSNLGFVETYADINGSVEIKDEDGNRKMKKFSSFWSSKLSSLSSVSRIALQDSQNDEFFKVPPMLDVKELPLYKIYFFLEFIQKCNYLKRNQSQNQNQNQKDKYHTQSNNKLDWTFRCIEIDDYLNFFMGNLTTEFIPNQDVLKEILEDLKINNHSTSELSEMELKIQVVGLLKVIQYHMTTLALGTEEMVQKYSKSHSSKNKNDKEREREKIIKKIFKIEKIDSILKFQDQIQHFYQIPKYHGLNFSDSNDEDLKKMSIDIFQDQKNCFDNLCFECENNNVSFRKRDSKSEFYCCFTCKMVFCYKCLISKYAHFTGCPYCLLTAPENNLVTNNSTSMEIARLFEDVKIQSNKDSLLILPNMQGVYRAQAQLEDYSNYVDQKFLELSKKIQADKTDQLRESIDRTRNNSILKVEPEGDREKSSDALLANFLETFPATPSDQSPETETPRTGDQNSLKLESPDIKPLILPTNNHKEMQTCAAVNDDMFNQYEKKEKADLTKRLVDYYENLQEFVRQCNYLIAQNQACCKLYARCLEKFPIFDTILQFTENLWSMKFSQIFIKNCYTKKNFEEDLTVQFINEPFLNKCSNSQDNQPFDQATSQSKKTFMHTGKFLMKFKHLLHNYKIARNMLALPVFDSNEDLKQMGDLLDFISNSILEINSCPEAYILGDRDKNNLDYFHTVKFHNLALISTTETTPENLIKLNRCRKIQYYNDKDISQIYCRKNWPALVYRIFETAKPNPITLAEVRYFEQPFSQHTEFVPINCFESIDEENLNYKHALKRIKSSEGTKSHNPQNAALYREAKRNFIKYCHRHFNENGNFNNNCNSEDPSPNAMSPDSNSDSFTSIKSNLQLKTSESPIIIPSVLEPNILYQKIIPLLKDDYILPKNINKNNICLKNPKNYFESDKNKTKILRKINRMYRNNGLCGRQHCSNKIINLNEQSYFETICSKDQNKNIVDFAYEICQGCRDMVYCSTRCMQDNWPVHQSVCGEFSFLYGILNNSK